MNIGSTTVAGNDWVDLETAISGLTLVADTAYSISFEGDGRICNASAKPSVTTTGFPIHNEKFGYTHTEGKLWALNTSPTQVIVNIAE